MKALLRSSVRRPAWLNNCREAVGTAMLKEDVPLEDALPFEQIPGPRPLPVIGTLYKYLPGGGYSFSRITECHTKMYRKYGPIVKEQLGPVTAIRLFDVKDVEKLLRVEGKYPRRPLTDLFLKHARDTGTKPSMVAAQGPEWHRQRYAVQRDMVSPQSVSAYIPAQEEVATALAEVVRNARNERGDVMDIAQYYYMYALEAIGLVCYDRRLGVFDVTEENKHNHHGYQVMLHAKTIFDNVLPMMNKWFLVERGFCKKQYQTYLNAVNGLLQATYGFMEEAERSGDTEKETLLNKLLKNEKVSREDVALIMMNLLGGGVESTGFTLAHMTYLLAKNPDKQETLYEELRRELPPGQPVTHEMLGRNLKYLRATLREVNRVSPAAAMSVLRVLDHDEVFGGYRVPAGCLLFVENTVMGLLPEYFEEPWKFEPERWLNRDINKKAAYIVLPFGHGPRSCVGRRFAEQELYLATIKLIQNFRIEYDGPDLGLINKTFQELDGPLNVRLIDRH